MLSAMYTDGLLDHPSSRSVPLGCARSHSTALAAEFQALYGETPSTHVHYANTYSSGLYTTHTRSGVHMSVTVRPKERVKVFTVGNVLYRYRYTCMVYYPRVSTPMNIDIIQVLTRYYETTECILCQLIASFADAALIDASTADAQRHTWPPKRLEYCCNLLSILRQLVFAFKEKRAKITSQARRTQLISQQFLKFMRMMRFESYAIRKRTDRHLRLD